MSGLGERIKDRVTVVETVYHRPFGDEATMAESRYSYSLKSQEQPYVRHTQATKDWQPLDYGWLKSVGLFLLSNDEGQSPQVNPTEEEAADLATRVIEIAYFSNPQPTFNPSWLVAPGQSMRAYPYMAQALHIRCQHATARYTLTLYPE